MTGWRQRLAELRAANSLNAKCADSAKTPADPAAGEGFGTFGTIGIDIESPRGSAPCSGNAKGVTGGFGTFGTIDIDVDSAGGGGAPLSPSPPEPDAWLVGIAGAIRRALGDGAVRVTDPEAGWLVLVRPDGRRTVVAPGTVEQLVEAGLLPELPDAVDPVVDAAAADAEGIAERGAIQAEPRLPPLGTPARAALDQRQAETVAGLLEASRVRPSCFEGDASRPPPPGAYCSACRGRGGGFRAARRRTGPRRPAIGAARRAGRRRMRRRSIWRRS